MSRTATGRTLYLSRPAEISPLAKGILYALTSLLIVAAVESGGEVVAFAWLGLGCLTLALFDMEATVAPAWTPAVAVLPGVAILTTIDTASGDAMLTLTGLSASIVVLVGFLLLRAAYPDGLRPVDGFIATAVAFQIGWLGWSAVAIATVTTFGTFGLFSALLLVRQRRLAEEVTHLTPFLYLGTMSAIALTA